MSKEQRPPHPATVPVERAPHPATVQRREAPFGMPKVPPPHPATLPRATVQPKAVAERAPHPVTVVQHRAALGGPAALPPHPATVIGRRAQATVGARSGALQRATSSEIKDVKLAPPPVSSSLASASAPTGASSPFSRAVANALRSGVTKYLILGDSAHGEKSLKSLAAAVKDGTLKPLGAYGVNAVLFEGARRGQELTLEEGRYAAAVKLLSATGPAVLGCEDDVSLSTLAELEKLLAKGPGDDAKQFSEKYQSLLDRRVLDANRTWVAQATEIKPKVILCVGTSHLPVYKHNKFCLVRRICGPAGGLAGGRACETARSRAC